jgi:hypothetical protein
MSFAAISVKGLILFVLATTIAAQQSGGSYAAFGSVPFPPYSGSIFQVTKSASGQVSRETKGNVGGGSLINLVGPCLGTRFGRIVFAAKTFSEWNGEMWTTIWAIDVVGSGSGGGSSVAANISNIVCDIASSRVYALGTAGSSNLPQLYATDVDSISPQKVATFPAQLPQGLSALMNVTWIHLSLNNDWVHPKPQFVATVSILNGQLLNNVTLTPQFNYQGVHFDDGKNQVIVVGQYGGVSGLYSAFIGMLNVKTGVVSGFVNFTTSRGYIAGIQHSSLSSNIRRLIVECGYADDSDDVVSVNMDTGDVTVIVEANWDLNNFVWVPNPSNKLA